MTKIIKQINDLCKSSIKAKTKFYEDLQLAYELFVAHYNNPDELNKNSTPLLNILKACGKEVGSMRDYIRLSTNILRIEINKEQTGCKLIFKDSATELTVDNDYIDSHKWYDKDVNKDLKALEYTDDNFFKRVKALIKYCEKGASQERIRALQALLPTV